MDQSILLYGCCLVYATMRNLDKKQRLLESVRNLHNDTMAILQMDITDQQSIGTVQRSIPEGRVDILGERENQGLVNPEQNIRLK